MAAASVTPPGSLDLLQPGFSKALLGTRLEDKYLCSACKNVLRRPFQAQCGHRYCSCCLTSILSSGPQNCAACVHEGIYEDGVSILESSSAFPDNAARREVESLPAVCPSDGCTWKGTLKEYESCHEGHCPFMLTECPACKGLVRLGEKEQHLEHECPERSLTCRHCRAPCCSADVRAHHQVCPKFPLTCDGCGKKKISRERFQDHVRTCGKCRVPCRFHAIGCPEMVEGEQQQEHEAQHLRECSRGNGGGGGTHTPARQEVVSVEAPSGPVPSRHVLTALVPQVQQLERSIGLKDLAMADLEQKVHEMEASTFDGVFIWKISDFARKRQEAVAGRTPAIFSPAFYTSRYGYKMCLRAYLNGDGTGRGTHLSLFFVWGSRVLSLWVLSSQVTLMLLDQNNREHVIDAFRPDVTSSSFQRPVSDMNIASGCPLFCPVSKMEAKSSYVRDDAIFIKAIVDLTGLQPLPLLGAMAQEGANALGPRLTENGQWLQLHLGT
uniref:TNF receptor-associated factor n=1 Tax=Camelus bactrianus TaxID=9837 RepID=A0A9W3G4N4_CAMBA|nr:TNF receptor-associated factor 2 [Camelus bactrianus]